MAYEISSSVANGTFSFQNVTASNAVDFNFSSDKTYPNIGQPSPNGDKIAVPTRFAGGATGQTGQNHGIDIYHSSSGGWTRQETIETEGIPSAIQWRTQYELWYYGEDLSGSTDITMLWYRTSGSSGWSDPKLGAGRANSFGRLDNLRYFIFNQQKDLIIAWEGHIEGQDITRWAMYYSGSQTSTNDGMWDGIRFARGGQFTEYGVTQCVAGPRSGDAQTLFLSDEAFGRVWSHEVDLSGWTTPDGTETSVSTIGSDFTANLGQASFPTEFPWITDNWVDLTNQSNGKQVNKNEGDFGGLLYWHSASNDILVQSSPGVSRTSSGDAWSAFNGSSNFKLYLYTSGSTGWFDNEQEILSDEVKPYAVTQIYGSTTPFWPSGLQPGYDENKIFYGTNGAKRNASTAWRGSISCLESGSEGWKITKDIHYPMIGSTFIGYSSTLLVANTQQENLTNPVSATSHALGTIADMHNATFSVAALPSSAPPPAVVITPGSITVSEAFAVAAAVVTLNQDPGPNTVNVDVSGLDSTEAVVNQTTQTLTTSNWNTGVTFIFTGQDDSIIDGDQTFDVTFTTTCSGDASFDNLTGSLSVTVEDNDTAGLTFLPGTSLSTTEQGASTVLSISLSAQPEADVIVTCTEPDSTEGTMSPSPVSFTFTSSNWNTARQITFTGIQDDEIDGNIQYTVTVSSTSSDAKFNNLSQIITITNVDSGFTAGETPPGDSFTAGGTATSGDGTRRNAPALKTQADVLPRKLHFEPSTIETIDKSVLNYLQKLDLFSNTNEGWKKVPVIWGTAERAYQVKHNKDIRDAQGMLKLPIISIRRVSISKDMASKGVFQGNISEIQDEQGGSVQTSRVIYQEKTTKFASADALRLHDQHNYPRPNPKVVYRTVMAPMPVNVTIMYEIVLRTEYQQQMNNLILPFVTNPGTINYVRLFEGEHRYEAFIQGDFQNSDNLSDFSSDERKFETKIQLKVIGYLIGQEDNREKPHYSIRENAVEVKIPRERISLNEVPPHEFGAYYGLSGIGEPLILSGFKSPFFFSNVPAVGDAGGGGGGGGSGDTSGNLVTTTNFASIMAQNLVIRTVLKDAADPLPSDKRTFTVTTGDVAANTETVYLNGVLQEVGSGKDYTISGNIIVFEDNLDKNDTVFITYIKS